MLKNMNSLIFYHRVDLMKKFLQLLSVISLVFLLISCASQKDPLSIFSKKLESYPEYSVILEDMKIEGNFFKSYYHSYKIITGKKETAQSKEMTFVDFKSGWMEVSEKFYGRFENYLGMTLLSKDASGKITNVAQPPGYGYVGDSRYGSWRTDSSGSSFWEFYGKYAFISSMFGMGRRPVYYNDYNTYRDYTKTGRTYYGQNNRYGTNGTVTKSTKKTFYERRKSRDIAKNERFSKKVGRRIGRSKTSGFRSRGGGFGK